jgi:hypothetical protein
MQRSLTIASWTPIMWGWAAGYKVDTNLLEEYTASIIDTEDDGSMFF